VHGGELWFSDGTVAGTHIVQDINTQPSFFGPSSANAGSGISNLVLVVNNELVFIADDVGFGQGRQLWTSDGTTATKLTTATNFSANGPGVDRRRSDFFFRL